MWSSSRTVHWRSPIGCTRCVLTSLSHAGSEGLPLSGPRPWASLPPVSIWVWPVGGTRERDERLAFTGCGPPLSLVAAPMAPVLFRGKGEEAPPACASLGLCQHRGSPSPAYSFVRSPSSKCNVGGCCLFCRNSGRSGLFCEFT